MYDGDLTQKVSDQKILKKEVLELIGLVHQDKMRMKNIPQIYPKLRRLFYSNQ